jgi:hypothetical protein
MRGLIVLALAAAEALASSATLGQRSPTRLNVGVAPPSPTTLGQQVTLGVRPTIAGATYRYVATMSVTGSSMFTSGTSCAAPQTIGTGASIAWTPASGAYRLTVHSIRSLVAHDSTHVNHQVDAPNVGFVNGSVLQNPTPQPPGRLTLSLMTANRGSGKRYQWVVRFSSSPGTPLHPPVYWTGDTPTPVYAVPFVVPPGTYNIAVRVGIHTGDPCRITETSIGSLMNQAIQ